MLPQNFHPKFKGAHRSNNQSNRTSEQVNEQVKEKKELEGTMRHMEERFHGIRSRDIDTNKCDDGPWGFKIHSPHLATKQKQVKSERSKQKA
jgi:hypothetical protein